MRGHALGDDWEGFDAGEGRAEALQSEALRGKRVLELGCGHALPGIVAAAGETGGVVRPWTNPWVQERTAAVGERLQDVPTGCSAWSCAPWLRRHASIVCSMHSDRCPDPDTLTAHHMHRSRHP